MTILLGLASIYDRFQAQKSETSGLPVALQIEVSATDLHTNYPAYKKELSWLLEMYEIALLVPHSSKRAEALEQVVGAALKEKDFNLAILAAEASPYSSKRADLLKEIISEALQSPDSIPHAVVAAEKIPYSSMRSEALTRIVSVYGKYFPKREGY
jgi:hypothetical protein